ncbi:MAG: Rab family GTPase [Candidatus Heimdallarchaeaceae archaeon]
MSKIPEKKKKGKRKKRKEAEEIEIPKDQEYMEKYNAIISKKKKMSLSKLQTEMGFSNENEMLYWLFSRIEQRKFSIKEDTIFFRGKEVIDSPYIEMRRLKVFVLGETGTGKTALYHSISNTEPEGEDTYPTDGINKHEIALEIDEHSSLIYWWDFAGQKDYRDTHKLFLTEDAFYILVLNLRYDVERNKIAYWLQSICDKAPNAKILPVLTHLDNAENILGLLAAREKMNMQRLFTRYGNQILPWITVSNKTKENIPKIVQILEEELEKTTNVLPALQLEIEQFILNQKDKIFVPINEIIEDLTQQFGTRNDYNIHLAKRTLEIMSKQGLLLLVEHGFHENIIVINVDEADKIIAKVINKAYENIRNPGILRDSDLEDVCADFFASDKIATTVDIIVDLFENLGLGIHFAVEETAEYSRILLIPHAAKERSLESLIQFLPVVYHPIISSLISQEQAQDSEMSKLIFELNSFDETFSSRLLGIINNLVSINKIGNVWRVSTDDSQEPAQLHALFNLGDEPIIYFISNNDKNGKFQLSLYFTDYTFVQPVHSTLVSSLRSYKANFIEKEILISKPKQKVKSVEKEMHIEQIEKTITSMQLLLNKTMDNVQQNKETISLKHKELEKIINSNQEQVTKQIHDLYKAFYGLLDNITNSCPRLVFIVEERAKLSQRVISRILETYAIVIVCENCFESKYLVDTQGEKVRLKIVNETARKAAYALSQIAKVVSIMYPIIFHATNLITNSLLEISIPNEKLCSIQTMVTNSSNAISMIKEKYQESPSKDEDPCNFLELVDTKGDFKNIIRKDRKTKKWLCEDC